MTTFHGVRAFGFVALFVAGSVQASIPGPEGINDRERDTLFDAKNIALGLSEEVSEGDCNARFYAVERLYNASVSVWDEDAVRGESAGQKQLDRERWEFRQLLAQTTLCEFKRRQLDPAYDARLRIDGHLGALPGTGCGGYLIEQYTPPSGTCWEDGEAGSFEL